MRIQEQDEDTGSQRWITKGKSLKGGGERHNLPYSCSRDQASASLKLTSHGISLPFQLLDNDARLAKE